MAAAVVGRRHGSMVSAFEPAWRTPRGRPGVEEDRFDFTSERNTPSTTNEFIMLELTMVQRVSPRLGQQDTVVCQYGT